MIWEWRIAVNTTQIALITGSPGQPELLFKTIKAIGHGKSVDKLLSESFIHSGWSPAMGARIQIYCPVFNC